HRLDSLLVACRRTVTLRRNHEIAKNRPTGRRLKPRGGQAERIELVAAGRHCARTPEIGKTELIYLHRNVLGEDGSPVFPAFGGDASKGWKHWNSLRDINAVTTVTNTQARFPTCKVHSPYRTLDYSNREAIVVSLLAVMVAS